MLHDLTNIEAVRLHITSPSLILMKKKSFPTAFSLNLRGSLFSIPRLLVSPKSCASDAHHLAAIFRSVKHSGLVRWVSARKLVYLTNIKIEKRPVFLFNVFLDLLSELRGDFLRKISGLVSVHIQDILYRRDLQWRYVFEKLDGNSLKQEPLDSPGFIQFCELEWNSVVSSKESISLVFHESRPVGTQYFQIGFKKAGLSNIYFESRESSYVFLRS